MAAMTYDSLEVLAKFSTAADIPYPLLRDVDVAYVNALGIRNTEYPPGHRGYGVPYPGILYIDAAGIIRLKFALPGYRKRPPMQQVYDALSTYLSSSHEP